MIRLPVEAPLTEHLYRRATEAGTPLSGTFELSPLCNLNCRMCYVRLSAQEQRAIAPLATVEDWLALAAKAAEQGMLYLLLTGGEPFAYPRFRDLLAGLHKMGLLVSINTNGTLIDAAVVEWLKETPPVRVNVTLYGGCQDTYARLCGDPQGYDKATEALRLLTEAGIGVRINYTITPDNSGDLPAVIALAQELNVPVQPTAYLFPPVRRDATAIGGGYRPTPQVAAAYTALAEYYQYGKDAILNRSVEDAPIPTAEADCAAPAEGVRCRAGRCSFWVTWQGQLLPCGMFPSEGAPNVLGGDFAAAWEQVKRDTAAIRLPAECAACAHKQMCHACAAMVITESGDFATPPAYRCAMTRAYPAALRRVKQQIEEGTL